MRFSPVLALVLAVSSATAWSQQHYKNKPYHSSAEDKGKSGGVPIKTGSNSSPTSQQLRKLEQESARGASPKGATHKQAHVAPVVKPEKEAKNPPIHFSSATGGGHTESKKQGGDPYKGRLKQKGSHH